MYLKTALLLIFLLFLLNLSTSQDYLKIKYFYQPKDLVIEKGKYNETFFVLENTYDETIFMVKLRYQIPSNFIIYQSEIDEILPKQKKSLRINISTTANEGLYNLTFWAESINEINGNKIQSQKYTLPVLVVNLNKTTSNTTITTNIQTTKINTTTTTNLNQTTNQTTTTTIEKMKKTIDPKTKVILIAIIAILLVIIFFILSR
ncbi:MAG: hypothetical protein KQA31_03045 [Candidatus Aenigmarchaeota archaeon]|nr:hypothetical protein [Candidatus Aenigmarchaeota archaeon]